MFQIGAILIFLGLGINLLSLNKNKPENYKSKMGGMIVCMIIIIISTILYGAA